MNNTKFVNVFQGNGEIDLPKPKGIAAKWFFIKAGCGNTNPAACVPFGAVSVGPYSGGYPTGYGDHEINSHSRPRHFNNGNKIIGFSHIHQSGTGAIEYYYNFAIVTPFYKNYNRKRDISKEKAKPGYYSCFLDDIKCELTTDGNVAFHKYEFTNKNGKIVIDFKKNGVFYPGYDMKHIDKIKICKTGNIINSEIRVDGINIYFAIEYCGKCLIRNNKVFIYSDNKTAYLNVAISLKSQEIALSKLKHSSAFNDAKINAEKIWDSFLSRIEIKTDSKKIKEIFYSNFYHSLIKPSNWNGESFIYESNKSFYSDFATLWDMYKTALPLIFMLYPDIGKSICESLILTGDILGFIPNNICLADSYMKHSTQARMLGTYVLLTAYRYGIDIDFDRMIQVIRNDVFSPDKFDFTKEGKCSSYTFFLDMADGCRLAADAALERGYKEIYNELIPLADKWKEAYSIDTGLLRDDSEYYEGTLYNYSFRQMVEMDERINIAGGKENFVKLLDKFFGYDQSDVVLPTDPNNYKPVADGIKLGRFEGFNNESDTESPYSYIYAGRHDRTCEIIRSGLKYMFTTGRGGLPGNNDSGALSSYYVLSSLGLFPVAGQDLFLIGSPVVDGAEINLFNDNKLFIKVYNNSNENIYVEKLVFNNENLRDFKIKAGCLLKGGTLEFYMTSKVK